MNSNRFSSLSAALAMAAILAGCGVTNVDSTTPAEDLLGSTVTTDLQTLQWRNSVKADLDQRLPSSLAANLAQGQPPRMGMAANVKAELDARLKAQFQAALDGVTPITAP